MEDCSEPLVLRRRMHDRQMFCIWFVGPRGGVGRRYAFHLISFPLFVITALQMNFVLIELVGCVVSVLFFTVQSFGKCYFSLVELVRFQNSYATWKFWNVLECGISYVITMRIGMFFNLTCSWVLKLLS